MTESERTQIKGALLKCAEENENKPTFTGRVVVSSVCRSALERIEELEKKNAEAKEIIKFLLDHCEHNEDKCTFSEYSDVIGRAEKFINEE